MTELPLTQQGKEKVCDDVVSLGSNADVDLDVDWHENIAEDEYDSLNENEEGEFDEENCRAYNDPFWGEVLSRMKTYLSQLRRKMSPRRYCI